MTAFNHPVALTMTLVAALMSASPAFAMQTFTVDSTADLVDDNVDDGICHTASGTCTLRAAVMQANRSDSAGATIELPAGTYTLSLAPTGIDADDNGDLNFSTPSAGVPIVLAGAGAAVTIIDAAQIDRVIAIGADTTVSISGVTITHGMSGAFGGGIQNQGTLTLTDAVVTENHCTSNGGGILNRLLNPGSTGSLTLLRTTVANNSTTPGAAGGGIMSNQALVITESTLRNNVATFGGGLDTTGAALTITRSAIVRNVASYGGGIFVSNSSLLVANSTISFNEGSDFGGGIYYGANDAVVSANLYNTTIAYNDVNATLGGLGFGGGVYLDNTGGTGFTLHNSLIAANSFGDSAAQDDCAGTLQSEGRNLLGDAGGCTVLTISGSWDLLNLTSSLGGLGDNGGPTETVALLPGSSAIDGGDPDGCHDDTAPLTTDQRGSPRPVGSACDVGAFEWTSEPADDTIFANGFDG